MATKTRLVGLRLRFIVSEPWEFEAKNGFCSLDGKVVRANDEALMFQSDKKVIVGTGAYDTFICSARLECGFLDMLTHGNDLWCSATGLPQEKINSSDPFDLSWWRGGGGVIGTLSVINSI